jgi:hypothetical protein
MENSLIQISETSVQLISPINIGVVVENIDGASHFLKDVFQTKSVERGRTAAIAESGSKIAQIGLGDALLQFMEPGSDASRWSRQLREFGPSVYTIAFYVSELDAAATLLEERGVRLLYRSRFEGDAISQSVCAFDTMQILGFNIELVQARDSAAVTNHMEKGPLHGEVSPLFHVEMVVDDIDGARDFLAQIFGAKQVEVKMSTWLEQLLDNGKLLRIVHIGLGGVVLQYCKPLTAKEIWYERLMAGGPSVINITWGVNDMVGTKRRLQSHGAKDLFAASPDFTDLVGVGNALPTEARIVDTRGVLGFNLELFGRFSNNMDEFLMNSFDHWNLTTPS